MHDLGHTIDNRIKFLYYIRLLLPSKSPILAISWCASLLLLLQTYIMNVIVQLQLQFLI